MFGFSQRHWSLNTQEENNESDQVRRLVAREF